MIERLSHFAKKGTCLVPPGSWLLLLEFWLFQESGRFSTFSSFPLSSSGGRQQHKKWCWWSTEGGFPPLFQLLQSDGASLCDAFLEDRKGGVSLSLFLCSVFS